MLHCFQEKCHQYWPSDRSVRYQCFVVDPIAEYNMPQYILREFKVRFNILFSRYFYLQSNTINYSLG